MQASAIKPMTLTKPGWCAGCPNHCPIVLLFKACLAFSSVIHQTYHHCACSVPRKRKINLTFSKNIKKRNLRKYINSNGYKFCYFGNPEYIRKSATSVSLSMRFQLERIRFRVHELFHSATHPMFSKIVLICLFIQRALWHNNDFF